MNSLLSMEDCMTVRARFNISIFILIIVGLFISHDVSLAGTLSNIVIDSSSQTFFGSPDTFNVNNVTIVSGAQNIIFGSGQDIVLGEDFTAFPGCSFTARPGLTIGTITGRLTSNGLDTGTGMSGIQVIFFDQTSGLILVTTTDAQGNYSISAPYGSYNISYNSNDYLFNAPSSVSLNGSNVVIATSQASPLYARDAITHTYDDLNRLHRTEYSTGTSAQYDFDEVGNRTHMTTTP